MDKDKLTAAEMFKKLGFVHISGTRYVNHFRHIDISYFDNGQISYSDDRFGQHIWDKDLVAAMLKLIEENEREN